MGAVFSHQHVRKYYLGHTIASGTLFLSMVVLLTLTKVNSNDTPFYWPIEITVNIMPMLLSALALVLLKDPGGGSLFTRVVDIINTFAFLVNVVVVTIFQVTDSYCHSQNTPSMLCNLPNNLYVRHGFEAILYLFIGCNILLYVCTAYHRKYCRMEKDTGLKPSHPDYNGSNMRFEEILHAAISLTETSTAVLLLESILLTKYSNVIWLFLFHVPNLLPFMFSVMFANDSRKRPAQWACFVSLFTLFLSSVGLGLYGLYYYKVCNPGGSSFIDDSCFIDTPSAVAYYVMHGLFTGGSLSRACAFSYGLYSSINMTLRGNKNGFRSA